MLAGLDPPNPAHCIRAAAAITDLFHFKSGFHELRRASLARARTRNNSRLSTLVGYNTYRRRRRRAGRSGVHLGVLVLVKLEEKLHRLVHQEHLADLCEARQNGQAKNVR